MKSVLAILLLGALGIPQGAIAGDKSTPNLTLEGFVIGVTDGDTITIINSTREKFTIRLASIDAPETKCYRQKYDQDSKCLANSQPFGVAAKQSLANKVFNKHVTININQKGSYGRYVGTVFLDGVDINLAQVQAGLAWHETRFLRFQSPSDKTKYAAAQQFAMNSRIGLWSDAHPEAPWIYRNRLKSEQ